MRVEAPNTFSTAYQQTKANRRQEKQDSQNLAFSIFNEKRARAKHQYQMDLGEEQVRHAKTVNPLMESLRLHENELKWGTLDADIGYAEERTRHAVEMNPLKESFARYKNKLAWDTVESDIANNKERTRHRKEANRINEANLLSDLEKQQYSAGQSTNYLAEDSQYAGMGPTEEQRASILKRRGLMDDVMEQGLGATLQEGRIAGHQRDIDEDRMSKIGEYYDSPIYQEQHPDVFEPMADNYLANQMLYPSLDMGQKYRNLTNPIYGDNALAREANQYTKRALEVGGKRIEFQNQLREDVNTMYEEIKQLGESKEDGYEEKVKDIWKKIEIMNQSMGGLLGGGNMMDNFMQRRK
tara:strand:- start:17788 stop:18849 length:1062 start_codon:yes stop_codon:yes gene_type:complete